MLKHRVLGLSILLVFVATLTIAGCRAAAPTATPVPPTPTKAAAPTVAPAPAPTTAPAPAVTRAPAPTAAPTATSVPVAQLKLPKIVSDLIARYPGIYYYTELPLPATQPRYGGTYTISAISPDASSIGTPHWDFRAGGVFTSGNGGACYAGLLRTSTDRFHNRVTHEVLPDAAESWKRLDDLTWEFKLNPNVFWHDIAPVNGRRVTAEDVKFGIEDLRDNSVFAGTFKIISEVIIKDPTTIVLKTSQPYAHLLTVFADASHRFVAPEVAKQPNGAKPWCVGFGPFKLVEFQPNGPWAAVRHPKYHIKGHTGLQLPYLDRVEQVGIGDAAAAIAALAVGKIHSTTVYDYKQAAVIMERCPKCGGMAVPNVPANNRRFTMRLDKEPFSDVRVRRAISMGMDRQAIIDTAFYGAAFVSQQIPIDAMGLSVPPLPNERGKYLQFNPTEAKRLLAEAGYPNGFDTVMDISASFRGQELSALEIAQFQLKSNLNINVKFNPLEGLAFNKALSGKSYQAMINDSAFSATTSWDAIVFSRMHSKSATNFYFINDPEMDKWAEISRTSFDPAKQREAFKKLFDLEEENIYRINTVMQYVVQMWNPSVENLSGSLYGFINNFISRTWESVWLTD
ncbi:MAG: ABC transporter substrate-binding protein [Chloroflexi bacterium]|nr:ABC transporter substrate-binding protein [Chloroflexota bacterium]